jgi:hypothetical protein
MKEHFNLIKKIRNNRFEVIVRGVLGDKPLNLVKKEAKEIQLLKEILTKLQGEEL